MPTRPSEFPTTFERSILQKIRTGKEIQFDEPGSKPALVRVLKKGWAEEVQGSAPVAYRLTPAGEDALKALIPLRR
jgi:hypothetical protein